MIDESILSASGAAADAAVPAQDTVPSSRWRVKRAVDAAGFLLVSLTLWGEIAAVVGNVILRKFFGSALFWLPDVSQLSLSILAFIGGALAYGQGSDLALSLLTERLPRRVGRRFEEAAILIVVAASTALAAVSISVLQSNLSVQTPVLHFSELWMVLPFTIGMVLFAFYGCLRLYDRCRNHTSLVQIVVLALLLAGLAEAIRTVVPLVPMSAVTPLIAIVFLGLLLMGVPIGFSLMGCAAFVITSANLTGPDIVPRTMSASTENFIFVAAPFFVFAGLLLTNTGVSDSIGRLILNLVGKFPGGFFHAIVVTMYLFSGLSGSKHADTLAIGSPLGDILERNGYSRDEGTAVLTASAVMGETVPPSLAILLLGSVTSLSVGTLFSAGLMPAAVLAVCLMLMIYLRARRTPKPTEPGPGIGALWKNTLRAIPGLLLPVLLIGGIVAGIATPTEVSSFAVVYGVFLIFAYRGGVRMFWDTMRTSLTIAGMLLFVLTAASSFSWLVTFARIPQDVASAAAKTGSHPWVFVVVSILVLIFFGAALEGAAALIVLAPILVPVATGMGVNPIQYGLVLIIAMGIGTHLPLIGVGFYVACTAMKAQIGKVIRPTLVYLAVLFLGLLLIAFYSPFTLLVPRWLGQY